MNTADPTPLVEAILSAATTEHRPADQIDFVNWPKFVYLIHFTANLHHTQHYLGASYDLFARLERHANGRGAAITRALWENAADWTLAALFVPKPHVNKSIFALEARAKKRKHHVDYCPVCCPKTHQAPPGMMQYPIPFPVTASSLRRP